MTSFTTGAGSSDKLNRLRIVDLAGGRDVEQVLVHRLRLVELERLLQPALETLRQLLVGFVRLRAVQRGAHDLGREAQALSLRVTHGAVGVKGHQLDEVRTAARQSVDL